MKQDFHTQMLSLIREVFGYNIARADESWEVKFARKKKHIVGYTPFLNGKWKAKFLNRLAPLKIECCLKYEKPKWRTKKR